ncbi:MAG: DUF167 family protein [Alphaproteobacteria bacterium]
MSTAARALPFSRAPNGILIAVRLTPRSARTRIEELRPAAEGQAALRVSVGAPPEDGKANAALIALLAREWKLAKRDISIKAGARGRNKTVRIAGDPEALLSRLKEWVSRRHGPRRG